MKRTLASSLLVACCVGAQAQTIPPPQITLSAAITPGQAPAYLFDAVGECMIYGAPCPSPEGVYYLTLTLKQTAAGAASATLIDDRTCTSSGRSGSGGVCYVTSFSNNVVTDESGNQVGSWVGNDWSAASLPPAVYTLTSTLTSIGQGRINTVPGTRTYFEVELQ